MGGDIQQEDDFRNFRLKRQNTPNHHLPTQVLLFVGNRDLPIRKMARSVLDLFTLMILTRVIGNIFQSNKFTACKVKDGIEQNI